MLPIDRYTVNTNRVIFSLSSVLITSALHVASKKAAPSKLANFCKIEVSALTNSYLSAKLVSNGAIDMHKRYNW